MWEKWKLHNIVGWINVFGKGVAKTGSSSASCACKKSLAFNKMSKSLKKVRFYMKSDGKNESFNVDVM